MQTIHVSLDKMLLVRTDRAARRAKSSRSALIREALREHLHRLDIRTQEERDRQGYERKPQTRDELRLLEYGANWADE